MRSTEFSERYSLTTPIAETINSVSEEIKVSAWNLLRGLITEKKYRDKDDLLRVLAIFFKITDDVIVLHNSYSLLKVIKPHFFDLEGCQFYDLLNYISQNIEDEELTSLFNECILENKSAPCRFIGYALTLITEPEGLKSINSATKTPHDTANERIKRASEALYERKYESCCDDAVSAVEALIKSVLNVDHMEFKKLINQLFETSKMKNIDGGLAQSIKSCWGYVSNTARHAQNAANYKKPNLEDAQFVLVYCSALINLIMGYNSK